MIATPPEIRSWVAAHDVASTFDSGHQYAGSSTVPPGVFPNSHIATEPQYASLPYPGRYTQSGFSVPPIGVSLNYHHTNELGYATPTQSGGYTQSNPSVTPTGQCDNSHYAAPTLYTAPYHYDGYTQLQPFATTYASPVRAQHSQPCLAPMPVTNQMYSHQPAAPTGWQPTEPYLVAMSFVDPSYSQFGFAREQISPSYPGSMVFVGRGYITPHTVQHGRLSPSPYLARMPSDNNTYLPATATPVRVKSESPSTPTLYDDHPSRTVLDSPVGEQPTTYDPEERSLPRNTPSRRASA